MFVHIKKYRYSFNKKALIFAMENNKETNVKMNYATLYVIITNIPVCTYLLASVYVVV